MSPAPTEDSHGVPSLSSQLIFETQDGRSAMSIGDRLCGARQLASLMLIATEKRLSLSCCHSRAPSMTRLGL